MSSPKTKRSCPNSPRITSGGLLAVLVLPTATDAETVKAARDGGYLVVLCDDPAKVVVKIPSQTISENDIMDSSLEALCAFSGLADPDRIRARFVQNLWKRRCDHIAANA